MWSIQTPWFDVATVMSIFAVGNILFGHFEEHKPKARRLLKVALVAGGDRGIVQFGTAVGRIRVYWSTRIGGGLRPHLVAAGPRDQRLDWEPKAKYYELIGARRGVRDE